MSRGGSLILDGNPKGYEVAEHISKKAELNPRMLSTLKNAKSIWSMNPGEIFDTLVVGPLGILVALIMRQIGQDYSNSGKFSGRPSMNPFLAIIFSLVIDKSPKLRWISWDLFWKSTDICNNNILVSVRVDLENFYLKIVDIVLSLVLWSPRTTLRVNKVTTFKRFIWNLFKNQHKIWGHLMI